jgi:5-(carboxyamino)imidazole ribonucleotide synthase
VTTVGVLGGGQLGRMFTVAARTMGYRVVVLDPDRESPAGAVADVHLRGDYRDRAALEELARQCAAITTEFENVPAESLDWLQQHRPVRPSAAAVAVAQDRIREKQFLVRHGLPTARFAAVRDVAELRRALQEVPLPALLKSSRFGYDGKGQRLATTVEEAEAAYRALGGPCVLEQRVTLQTELSVVLARTAAGAVACYPIAENRHRDGILELTLVPAQVPASIARRASAMAIAVVEALAYCGVLAVEFFVTTDQAVLINELAPRPHNSGHYTLDACLTSQFEQQVRTLCELSLGGTRLTSPAAMVNLLGHLWQRGEPPWQVLLGHSNVKLHLYGKRQARPGRKMGHFTCLGDTPQEVLTLAQTLAHELRTKTLPQQAAMMSMPAAHALPAEPDLR